MFFVRHQWLAMLLALAFCAPVFAQDEEVDFVELAAVLVQDGNYDRAENALQNVELAAGDIDLGRYHSIYGLIHMNRGNNELAIQSFNDAINNGLVDETTEQTPEVIYIYLAQCHYGLEQYRETIRSLERAGETARRLSSTHSLRAHSHWLLGEKRETWAVLDQASRLFPANNQFLRRKVFYLIEMGLFKEAAELGRAYLDRAEGNVDDYVAIGNALRKAGDFNEALGFLEAARLQHPAHENVGKVLAHTYIARGDQLAAAEIFQQLAQSNPELISEAAELYRRAGKPYRALTLNQQIVDPATKLKQRLAIFLALERFDQITAMEDAMIRAGLLTDENLIYALAYAWFKVGDFRATERYLTRLTQPDLFRKATELREVMEDCADERWKCS